MIGKSFQLFFDGTKLANLSTNLKETLLQANLNNKDSASFVGIIYEDSNYNVFLPKGFVLDQAKDEPIDICRLLIKTFLTYQRNNVQGARLPIGSVMTTIFDEPFFGLLANYRIIIEYYKKRGHYSRHINQKTVLGQGRINWGDTIKQEAPFLTKRGVPIYPQFRNQINRNIEISSIVQIQKYLTRLADLRIGWLLSQDNREIMFPELANENLKESLKRELWIFQLKKEQIQVFDDERIEFLKALINVINAIDYQYFNTQIIGVKHFWAVWEHIMKCMFKDESPIIVNRLPKPEYLFTNKTIVASNKLLPDIVLSGNEGYLVLDAKYYDVSNTLPSWYDIVKQSYYRLVIEKEFHSKVIVNGFILPEISSESQPLEVSINRYNESRPFDKILFPSIKCFYFSMRKAIEDYVFGNRDIGYIDSVMQAAQKIT